MTYIRYAFIAFAAVSFLLGTHAYAYTANDAEAEKLRQAVQGAMNFREKLFESTGAEVNWTGDLVVEPNGGYYAVTLPHLKIKYYDGTLRDFGMFAMNAVPAEKDGRWKLTIAIPTPITDYDDKGNEVSRIVIGSQRMAGVWDENIDNYMKLDAAYGDIVYQDLTDKSNVFIDEIVMTYDMDEQADGKWSGPANFTVKEVQFKDPGEQVDIGFDALKLDARIKDFDPGKAQAFRDDMIANVTRIQETPIGQAHEIDPNAFFTPFMDYLENLADGYGFTFTAEKLVVSNTDQKTQGEFSSFQADRLSFGMDMDGLLSNAADIGMLFGFDNMQFKPLPNQKMTDVMPHSLNIDFTLHEFPYKDVLKMGTDAIQQSVTTAMEEGGQTVVAAEAQDPMIQFMQLPAMLTQAGSYLKVDNTYIANALSRLDMHGSVTPNQKAMMGVTADYTMKISNLAALLQKMGQLASDPTVPQSAQGDMQSTIAMLTMLQALGQQESDANGQTVHRYHLVMNEQGQMLLNGTDMSMMMGMMGGSGTAKAKSLPPVTPQPAQP